MPAPFRQDMSPVEKPGRGSRTCRAQPGKRRGGSPSLGYFSLRLKRSNAPSAGGRNALTLPDAACRCRMDNLSAAFDLFRQNLQANIKVRPASRETSHHPEKRKAPVNAPRP